MTFANTEMKQFKDLTPEQRSEIVEAWLKGNVEYFNDHLSSNWLKKDISYDVELCSTSIYRVKPLKPLKPSPKLDIPWHLFKHEWKWAAKDSDGGIYLFTHKPIIKGLCWYNIDDVSATSNLNHNFEPDGEVDWKQSLIERPIGE